MAIRNQSPSTITTQRRKQVRVILPSILANEPDIQSHGKRHRLARELPEPKRLQRFKSPIDITDDLDTAPNTPTRHSRIRTVANRTVMATYPLTVYRMKTAKMNR